MSGVTITVRALLVGQVIELRHLHRIPVLTRETFTNEV